MTTIAINIKNGAPSQYTNFDFNSMCELDGKILCAGPTGLFSHEGSTDDGVEISASITLPTSDHKIDARKSYRYAYIHGEFGGDMEISALCDSENEIGPFTFTADSLKGQQRIRAQMGRGLYFDYGAVTISNVDGAFFSLDRVDVVV